MELENSCTYKWFLNMHKNNNSISQIISVRGFRLFNNLIFFICIN